MIDLDRVRSLAPGSPLAAHAILLERTASTMDEARAAALGGRSPVLVVAEAQTAGRGREGRSWYSAPGESLTFTAAIGFAAGTPALASFTLAVGVALHRLLEKALGAGSALTLKWPNDLLCSGRKIAGVLCEGLKGCADGRDVALVGVGLDVNSASFPPEIAPIATSMRLVAGREFDRSTVLAGACAAIEGAAGAFAAGGIAPFLTEYRSRCTLWGRRCRVGGVEGTMETVDGTGALVLVLADGTTRAVDSGHVEII